VRATGRPAHRHHQSNRAFLLERGIAVRQGLNFLRAELPAILAKRTDVLSPRMLHVVEDLAGDWRRLDERIEALSDAIMTLARQDKGCERLMTVPGIGPIISSAMVAAIGAAMLFRRAAPRQHIQAAIVICARCSFRPPGSCWSKLWAQVVDRGSEAAPAPQCVASLEHLNKGTFPE
jgi:hypothetical protein